MFRILGRWRLFAGLAGMCFASSNAPGLDLSFALGGLATGVQQGDTTGTLHPMYVGGGAQAEIRFSFYSPVHPATKFSIFGTAHDAWLTNANSATGERNHHVGYGGGLELGYKWFFIGLQAEAVSSTLTKTSGFTLANLNFGEYGARAGVNINLNRRFSLTFGVLGTFDSTRMNGDNGGTVTSSGGEIRSFILLRFTLFRPKAVWDVTNQWKK